MITLLLSSPGMATSRTTPVPHHEVVAGLLATDPAYRTEHERTKVASALALAVFTYRTERGMSQRALADVLDMRQPQVARLEAGDVTPTMETLCRVSKGLGLRIRIEIGPDDPDSHLAAVNTAFTQVEISLPPPA